MRISTAQMQTNGLNAILDRQSVLSKTQQQLATGKRILNPSDDVNGTVQALAMKKSIATHEQYQRNTNIAQNRLEIEESTLTNVINIMQRVHELAIQSESPTLSTSGRQNLAPEVRALLGEMVSLANTTDSAGEYLFSGFNVGTAPITVTENPPASEQFDYAYTGDTGQRTVQIGPSLQVEVGDDGQGVFMDIPIAAGGNQSIFETIEQFALDLESNTPSADITTDIQTAMQHMSLYRSLSGSRQAVVEDQRSFNDDVILHSKTTLSDIQDLDIVEAISRMNLELVGLEASQQSFTRIQNLSLFNFL